MKDDKAELKEKKKGALTLQAELQQGAWCAPANKKQFVCFFFLTNFYRVFLKHYCCHLEKKGELKI